MTQHHDSTREGVAEAWDFWLSQHDVSVPDTIAQAVRAAVREWLSANGDLVAQAIATAVRPIDQRQPAESHAEPRSGPADPSAHTPKPTNEGGHLR